MADLEAQIPEQIEDRLDHRLGPVGRLPGRDEGDVDIRRRRHLAPPIAAGGEQQQPFGLGRIGQRMEPLDDIIMRQPDDLVGEEGVSGGDLGAGIGPLLQPPRDLRAAGRQRLLETAARPRAGPPAPSASASARRSMIARRCGIAAMRGGHAALLGEPLQPIDQLQRLARAERIGLRSRRAPRAAGRPRALPPLRRRTAAGRRAPPRCRRSRRGPPPAWRAPPWPAPAPAAAGRRAWRPRCRSCGRRARPRLRAAGRDRPSIRARGHGGATAPSSRSASRVSS